METLEMAGFNPKNFHLVSMLLPCRGNFRVFRGAVNVRISAVGTFGEREFQKFWMF